MILAIRDPLQRDVAIEAAAQRLGLASAMFRRHLSSRSDRRSDRRGDRHGDHQSGRHQHGGPQGPSNFDPQSGSPMGSSHDGQVVMEPGPPGADRKLPVIETALLTFLLDAPDATLTALESRDALQAFSHPAIQAVFDAAISARTTGGQLSTHEALTLMQNHGVRDDRRLGMLRETLLNPLSQSHDPNDCVTGLLKQHKKLKLAELRTQSAGETDPEVIERLAAEINKVMSLKI